MTDRLLVPIVQADGAAPRFTWYDDAAGKARPISELVDAFAAGEVATADGRAWAELTDAEQRAEIEDDLKSGRLRCVVATSSLELGIDMGAVDLVLQVAAPMSVSSLLQRVGRAGHQVGAISKGVVFPKYRGDLVSCAVVAERMAGGAIACTCGSGVTACVVALALHEIGNKDAAIYGGSWSEWATTPGMPVEKDEG